MSTINLTSDNFEEVVLKSHKPILIDFWASWCGPCRMQSPVIEKLSKELEDSAVGNSSAVIAKLNVDENPELATQFSVMSIPTLIIIKNGKIVDRKTGITPKATLLSMLNSVNV